MPTAVEWSVTRLAETDSTNRVVLEMARDGAREGTVVVAAHQTAGRGRLGRSWQAPPGSSLLVTALLRPPLAIEDAHLVSVAAALAAADACDEVAGVRPPLKWPNDLIVERDGATRKLAGLLGESIVTGAHLDAVALGMGLNVQWPSPLPDDLAPIATALNHEAARDIDPDVVLDAWLARFATWYAQLLAEGGADAVVQEYRRGCATIGRDVRVELATETFTGRAVDVTRAGHLLVATDGTTREVTVGDVVHVRPA